MRRDARAEIRLHADRLRARDVVDVEHARLVEHGQVRRFTRALHQRAQVRPRLADDVHLAPHQHAELEQLEPEPVCAGLRIACEEAGLDERRGDPVHGALGEPEPARQVADADLVLGVRERLDEPRRIRDRRQPRAARPARFSAVAHPVPPTRARSAFRNTSLPSCRENGRRSQLDRAPVRRPCNSASSPPRSAREAACVRVAGVAFFAFANRLSPRGARWPQLPRTRSSCRSGKASPAISPSRMACPASASSS